MSDTTRIFYTDGELSNALDVIRRQTVEIERLRAALRAILDWKDACHFADMTPWVQGIHEWNAVIQRTETIARKALGESDE